LVDRDVKMANYKIFKNVNLGKNSIIEDYSILGKPPIGFKDGELITSLGDNTIIRSNTIVYAGNRVNNNFQTGHGVLVREKNSIDADVTFGSHSILEGYCKVGRGVVVHSNCFIGEHTQINQGAWIGPGCVTLLTPHPRCKNKSKCSKGPTIGRFSVIGAGSIVLPGVKVGNNSLIGAGSIVTKNIPAKVLAYGAPAEVIKSTKEIKCQVGLKYERDDL
tara:strand:+ start:1439 stop:2095 length:657 start_codon:yes stop_codon:yes gene_type:complete